MGQLGRGVSPPTVARGLEYKPHSPAKGCTGSAAGGGRLHFKWVQSNLTPYVMLPEGLLTITHRAQVIDQRSS